MWKRCNCLRKGRLVNGQKTKESENDFERPFHRLKDVQKYKALRSNLRGQTNLILALKILAFALRL